MQGLHKRRLAATGFAGPRIDKQLPGELPSTSPLISCLRSNRARKQLQNHTNVNTQKSTYFFSFLWTAPRGAVAVVYQHAVESTSRNPNTSADVRKAMFFRNITESQLQKEATSLGFHAAQPTIRFSHARMSKPGHQHHIFRSVLICFKTKLLAHSSLGIFQTTAV